ncbi:branched-chain amino acid aminotransferase [Vagococcus salmoninarum]|uniref:branched-chain amino acid aminotransferase n=1 Tax=Vagococcus salmoninarum TaxID=2739 RepID=UPI003F95E7D3
MVNIDWNNLGFNYIKTPLRFIAHYKDGQWDQGKMTEDNTLHIHEGSTAIHYGQQCFEGMKAYRCQDDSINLFRPFENAKRLNRSAERLRMPAFPEADFVAAVKSVVKANADYVPPYDSGATLYIRPLLIGVGENIGVRAAQEYILTIFCTPVGPYFKGGLAPSNFIVSDYDRAAPMGTGAVKVGGNYAASLYPGTEAQKQSFADCVYLDPETHTKIEEVGAANFYGITKDNQFITPKSPSILPSITKYSLLHLAQERFNLESFEGDVRLDELDKFVEAGACGTAAVISPIGGIQLKDRFHVFHSETEVGPITEKLYNELVGIQFGDIVAPAGWIEKV